MAEVPAAAAAASGLDPAGGSGPDRIEVAARAHGLERLRARFGGRAFARHRHDTYTVCVTDSGLQGFDYRGAARLSVPGQVVVLHPDEPHDGRAAGDGGFGYRGLNVAPERIATAAREVCGRAVPLPFAPEPVFRDAPLAAAVEAAFRGFPADLEPLAADAIVLALAEGLVRADPTIRHRRSRTSIDRMALRAGQDYLDVAYDGIVSAEALERVSGLNRYAFARQFRQANGTSPYRYLLLRRLDRVRERLAGDASLAAIAIDLGFADQAHMSRSFKAAYGLTPARYRRARRG